MAAVAPGAMLGRYKVLAELGTGSFGSVWLAEDTWLAKKVALKIPHNQKSDASKLMTEPKLLAALEHPNIVRLLTVEKAEDVMFMVMEFVEGRSLRERLGAGPVPVPEAVEIARSMLDALAHAHQKGVVHRDLKPANILMTPAGQVKITDFGTAHALQGGEETVAAGTLFYMSKEQLLGRVMPASDLYSVAVILFEMLTGRLPFFDETGARVIQKILSTEPAPDAAALNRAVPPELAGIVRRGLERDLATRWKSAAEFLEALDAWKAGKPVPAGGAPVLPHPAYETFSRRIPRLAETLNRTHAFVFRSALGGRGRGDGQLSLPVAAAVDVPTGRIFVTDAIRGHVQVYDRDGKHRARLGTEGTVMEEGVRFHNPTALAVDARERLYVCDTKNSRIQILTTGGQPVATFGRPMVVVGLHEDKGVVGFNFPRGLALDEAEGILYVADSGNNRLKAFTVDGAPIQSFGGFGERAGEFNAPLGIAVGAGGRLYVADSQNFRVQVFERGFKFIESFGKRGAQPGEFPQPPVSVAVALSGEVLVCDDTDRIQVFGENGTHAGYITGARTAGASPKYYSVTPVGGEELLAIDEHGCQVHRFVYQERA